MHFWTMIALNFCTKAIFSTCFFVVALSSALAVHAQDEDIKWFDSFFSSPSRKDAGDLITEANNALDKAIESDDLVAQAKALNEIALIYLTHSHDYDKSMEYFIRALSLEEGMKLREPQVFTYLGISQIYFDAADYNKCANFLDQALQANENNKNARVLVFILNKLGNVNALRGRVEDAFANFQQVLDHKEELADSDLESEALFSLGKLRSLQGKFTDALDYHKQALRLRRSIGSKKQESSSLNEIGELYRLMKNNEKSLANHVVALEIRQSLSDKKGIAESYNNIAALYFEQKNIERAIANLELALQAGQEAQDQNQIRRSYDYLNQCFKALGNYQKALEYSELHAAITEFIQHEKNERQVLETENRYVIEQHEAQIDKLEVDTLQKERELEAQRQLRNLLFSIIMLSALVIALTLYLYIVKRKTNKVLGAANLKISEQNAQLVQLNATKDKFFSIISHDLKGPLNSLTSFSGLLINHTDSLSKEEIQMLAKDLDKSLKNLFGLLDNLLEWSRSQTGNIDYKAEVFDVHALLESNVELLKGQALNKSITLRNDSKTSMEVRAHKNSVNTVIRNLISNSIKFTPRNGEIVLGVDSNVSEVIVSVTDNGVGMSDEVVRKLFRIDTKHTTKGTAEEKGTGLGLILCKEFIDKNGGRIWVSSTINKGSTFYFALPRVATQTVTNQAVYSEGINPTT
jgi:signal transduction histidine kinase